MNRRTKTGTARSWLSFVMAGLVMLIAGCSSGEEGGTGHPADGGTDEFCSRFESATEDEALASSDDPEAAAAAADEVRELASEAPEEITGALGAIADMLDEVAEMERSSDAGEGGLEDFGRIMELMFDPDLIAATKTLEKYAVSQCGFDPDEASERFGMGIDDGEDADGRWDFEMSEPDPADPEESQDPEAADPDEIRTSGDISLEDLDEVKAAHSDESWSAKIVSSGISGNQYIQLFGKGPDDEYIEREPLSIDESLAACEAMRDAFGGEQPDLEVSVGNGDEVLVTGTVSEACAPV